MELLQLKYFAHAAECENFSHTAKHFMLPPSAISQSIRRLERELGVALFVRNANRLRLSSEGREFYASVKDALATLDSARERLRGNSDNIKGNLRLFIGTNRRAVIECIEKYRRTYPGVVFQVNHGVAESSSSYDLIIGDGAQAHAGMKAKLLIREQIALAVPKGAQFDGLGEALYDYRHVGFIAMHKEASLTKLTRRVCLQRGFEPNIVVQSDDPAYVRRYLELGLGVALFPTFSWKGMFDDSIRLVNIDGCFRDTFVYYRDGKYSSSAARIFAEMLEQFFPCE